jgi:uncharacterized protein with FMN-binding domain
MKKSLVAILAVAIIGTLGIITKGHKSNDNTSVQAASTSTSTTPTSTDASASQAASSSSTGAYKDGTYTGATEDTEYGTVQVAAVVSGGKITDIKFLQMPGPEGHSKEVTAFSESPLKQSTISNQNAHIDFVSGATTTSQAYEQSLQAALDQAA